MIEPTAYGRTISALDQAILPVPTSRSIEGIKKNAPMAVKKNIDAINPALKLRVYSSAGENTG